MTDNFTSASANGAPRECGSAGITDRTPPLRLRPSPVRGLTWNIDPWVWALEQSRWRREESLPEHFCLEVGRRLLLAQLEFSEWVLRRVEKIAFSGDRLVERELAVDLAIHHEAPKLKSNGYELFVVPLTLMRRRTIVNLDIQDERSHHLTMPGIRLTQQFDQSMLLAAASLGQLGLSVEGAGSGTTSAADWVDVRRFVRSVVAGDYEEVTRQLAIFDHGDGRSDPPWMALLRRNRAFVTTLNRLRRNFTLYTLLSARQGSQRLIRIRFSEPIDWGCRKPEVRSVRTATNMDRRSDELALDRLATGARPDTASPSARAKRERVCRLDRPLWASDADRGYRDEPVPPLIPWRMWARLGVTPTRLRFHVPGAEYAASYHLEFTAPTGARVVSAALVAGRPNEPERRASVDHIVGHSPTIGLHAVEVPNGSLCQAQVDLRIPVRGWLATTVIGATAALSLQAAVIIAWQWQTKDATWTQEQVTNLVLLLATTSAALVALVAGQQLRGVAARLVTPVRAAGIVFTALPIVTAILLVFFDLGHQPDASSSASGGVHPGVVPTLSERVAMYSVGSLSLGLTMLVVVPWIFSFRAENRLIVQESPWDMTTDTPRTVPKYFESAYSEYGFDSPAVTVFSAEGWQATFSWSDTQQRATVEQLQPDRFWHSHLNTGSSAHPAECAHHASWAGCAYGTGSSEQALT